MIIKNICDCRRDQGKQDPPEVYINRESMAVFPRLCPQKYWSRCSKIAVHTQNIGISMPSGDSRPCTAAMTTTEDAKTVKYTAGGPCGAYIETPCKFETGRAY